jgi:hypothetical protein
MKSRALLALTKSLSYLAAFGGESGELIVMTGVIDLDKTRTFEQAAASCGALVVGDEFVAGYVVVDNSCDMIKDVVRPVSESSARSYADALCLEAGDDALEFTRETGCPLYEPAVVRVTRGMFEMARRQHMASSGRFDRATLEVVLGPGALDRGTREGVIAWCLDPDRTPCTAMEDALEYSVWHGVCAVARSDINEWRSTVIARDAVTKARR